jgi:hypothetical protein
MISNIKNIFEMFYYFFGGIGLFLAGIAGLKLIFDWSTKTKEQNRIKKKTSELMTLYPFEELNKSFRLIRGDIDKRPIYLHDYTIPEKRWINSPETLRALGFDFNMVKTIPQLDIDSIKVGEEIHIY